MLSRRSFLGGILAAASAPAVVKAEILMPVKKIIRPPDVWTYFTGDALSGEPFQEHTVTAIHDAVYVEQGNECWGPESFFLMNEAWNFNKWYNQEWLQKNDAYIKRVSQEVGVDHRVLRAMEPTRVSIPSRNVRFDFT